MTPNEIHNKRFEKAMSGYRPEDVGAFLAEIADYVEELQDEKAEIEQKLMVLAEKLEEYREDEDSLRAALIGAQKLGDSVVRESKRKAEEILEEATQKSEKILTEASEEAEVMITRIKGNIERETDALNKMQAEVARFKGQILSMYRQHIEMVNSIPYDEKDFPPPAPKHQEPQIQLVEEYEPEPEPEIEAVEEAEVMESQTSVVPIPIPIPMPEAAPEPEAPTVLADPLRRNSGSKDFIMRFDDDVPDTTFKVARDEQFERDQRDESEKEDPPKRESRHGNLLFGDKYTLTRKD